MKLRREDWIAFWVALITSIIINVLLYWGQVWEVLCGG